MLGRGMILIQPTGEHLTECFQTRQFIRVLVVVTAGVAPLRRIAAQIIQKQLVEPQHHIPESPFHRLSPREFIRVVCRHQHRCCFRADAFFGQVHQFQEATPGGRARSSLPSAIARIASRLRAIPSRLPCKVRGRRGRERPAEMRGSAKIKFPSFSVSGLPERLPRLREGEDLPVDVGEALQPRRQTRLRHLHDRGVFRRQIVRWKGVASCLAPIFPNAFIQRRGLILPELRCCGVEGVADRPM